MCTGSICVITASLVPEHLKRTNGSQVPNDKLNVRVIWITNGGTAHQVDIENGSVVAVYVHIHGALL